jgi:polyisoprenoid-binding protein YceI
MLVVVALVLHAGVLLAQAGSRTFSVDAAASHLVIHVGRSGALSFAGHDHEVIAPAMTGQIVYIAEDPSQSTVSVTFDAAKLRVTGQNEPAKDVAEVQETMVGPRVLDVGRFPTIAFQSREVSVDRRQNGQLVLRVTGDLTLHGVTRLLTATVTVKPSAGEIEATGTVRLRQTDFGMKPVSAGSGTVRVKDEVEVTFTLRGR